jgi:hypothetical protein
MVLAQVFVQAGDASNLYDIHVHGRKRVKVLGINYIDNLAATRNIIIQSNVLYSPFGNVPYIMFCNKPGYNVKQYNDFELVCQMDGQLDITVLDYATKATPGGFASMILYLDIEDFDAP